MRESAIGPAGFVAEFMSSLMSASSEGLDHDIRDGLERLAHEAGVERGSFARLSDGPQSLVVTHSFGTPAIPTPFGRDLRWYLDQIQQGKCPVLNRLPDDLPAEASAERDAFRTMRIRSHVAVPISRAGRIWGVIGLASSHQSHPWTADDMHRIRAAGEIIATVMLRQEMEETTRRLREELTHVARVVALGDLTVAITHELSQPLTAIRANAQATKRLLARGVRTDELEDVLDDIVHDSTRAADLIVRLANLFKRRELEKLPVDLNQVVRDFQVIADTEARRGGAHLLLRLGSGMPQIMADAVQLQQVLLNLIRNSVEAMVGIAPPAREVQITTAATSPREVTLSVGDSGPAIADTVFERLFSPFYTTKPDGLGMGLPISRSIVEAHGGRLWAERRSAGGLLMRFTLPAA